MEALAGDPFSRQSRKLVGSQSVYRLRAGMYRVVYKVDTDKRVTEIQYVRHRREVYR